MLMIIIIIIYTYDKTPGSILAMEFVVHEVKSSDHLKILGVTIDNKLTFSEHISNLQEHQL